MKQLYKNCVYVYHIKYIYIADAQNCPYLSSPFKFAFNLHPSTKVYKRINDMDTFVANTWSLRYSHEFHVSSSQNFSVLNNYVEIEVI
jgi:hypothetical protein